MCNGNDTNGAEELTSMAARFIAETNAFLDQFWANPRARWPMKADRRARPEPPRDVVAAEVGGGIGTGPDAAVPARLGGVPELVMRIKRLQQSQPADGASAVINAGGDPPVYIIFLVVPEESPVGATEALTAIPSGVRTDRGRPIGTDVPPPASRHDATDPKATPKPRKRSLPKREVLARVGQRRGE